MHFIQHCYDAENLFLEISWTISFKNSPFHENYVDKIL